jgi:hypothetical protein
MLSRVRLDDPSSPASFDAVLASRPRSAQGTLQDVGDVVFAHDEGEVGALPEGPK